MCCNFYQVYKNNDSPLSSFIMLLFEVTPHHQFLTANFRDGPLLFETFITTYSVFSQPVPTHNHFLLNHTSTFLLNGLHVLSTPAISYNIAYITSMNRNWLFVALICTRFYSTYSKGFCYFFPLKVINQTSQITQPS